MDPPKPGTLRCGLFLIGSKW